MAVPALTSTALVSSSAQTSAESTVAAFVSAHPEPTFTEGGSNADFAAFKTKILAYWKTVPWEAAYAQWGCVTDGVVVSNQTSSDGTTVPVVGANYSCGGNNVASDAAALVPNSLNSKTAFLSTKLGASVVPAAVRASYTRSAVATKTASAVPAAAAIPACNAPKKIPLPSTAYKLCMGMTNPGTGTLTATVRYDQGGSSATARVRIGGPLGGTGCAAGSQLALGPQSTKKPGSTFTATAAVQEDANWSNTWIVGGSTQARACFIV